MKPWRGAGRRGVRRGLQGVLDFGKRRVGLRQGEGLAAVLRRTIRIVAVLLAGALDFTNRLVEVAHLRGVALLHVLDGLLEAADPALDGGDEFSG